MGVISKRRTFRLSSSAFWFHSLLMRRISSFRLISAGIAAALGPKPHASFASEGTVFPCQIKGCCGEDLGAAAAEAGLAAPASASWASMRKETRASGLPRPQTAMAR